jgi:hypothetical protein
VFFATYYRRKDKFKSAFFSVLKEESVKNIPVGFTVPNVRILAKMDNNYGSITEYL